MKIVAISDTHGSKFVDKIPDGDLLLIAGDISPVRLDHSFYPQQTWFVNSFIPQLKMALNKFKNIVFIGGNHDTYLSEVNKSNNNDTIRSLLPNGVHYLCDSMVEINGLKIWGSPWCNIPTWASKGPPVWNFATVESELADIYAKIPNDIDILLTHGPAYSYSDKILDEDMIIIDNNNLGSTALLERIYAGLKAKYVLSGHIHSAERNFQIYKSFGGHEIKFSCLSILNERYSFSDNNQPLCIDL